MAQSDTVPEPPRVQPCASPMNSHEPLIHQQTVSGGGHVSQRDVTADALGKVADGQGAVSGLETGSL